MIQYYNSTSEANAYAPCRCFRDATSSISTNGTSNLPERPTHSVVDAFFVCLVHGDVLQSEGVGLDGLN